MLQNLVQLMRPSHYLKNGLIFVPLIFSGQLLSNNNIINVLFATVVFSIVASIVYVINDIRDLSNDRKHPVKKYRPLASGSVSVQQAVALVGILLTLVVIFIIILKLNVLSSALLVIYVLLNFGYSFGLKNIPVIDVAILASGFVIRVLFGASVLGIEVSGWLYLTVLSGALYASLGKRRNEIRMIGFSGRKVNRTYSLNFLDKNMYVTMALVLVFYSLWAIDSNGGEKHSLFWTIPVVIIFFMTYSLNIERQDSTGDPVDVIIGDKMLILLCALYLLLTVALLYT